MKTLKLIFGLSFLLILNSCSSDSPGSSTPAYAMTAKIEGVQYEMNNAFGNNEDGTTIWAAYPSAEFIRLQGSIGGFGGSKEINIWIKRTDLVVGTYLVSHDTEEVTTHVDLIDLTTAEYEDTISGSITITEVNTTNKTVKGTFEFNASEGTEPTDPVSHHVTDGTFNYVYDVD